MLPPQLASLSVPLPPPLVDRLPFLEGAAACPPLPPRWNPQDPGRHAATTTARGEMSAARAVHSLFLVHAASSE